MNICVRFAGILWCAGLCLPVKSFAQHHTTIVYNIAVQKNSHKAGIEQTYNGGTKTIFIADNKARIRLTVLMRVQSIFFDLNEKKLQKATVVKENGKNKYLFRLSPSDWKLYNKKYAQVDCDTSLVDSLEILGYRCRKIILKPEGKREVIAFYTDSLHINNQVIDPLFSCINGAVLQYELTTRRGTMLFKAGEIAHDKIDSSVFTIPKGITAKKYNPNKKPPKDADLNNDEE